MGRQAGRMHVARSRDHRRRSLRIGQSAGLGWFCPGLQLAAKVSGLDVEKKGSPRTSDPGRLAAQGVIVRVAARSEATGYGYGMLRWARWEFDHW